MGWRKWAAVSAEIGGAMLPGGLSSAAAKAAELLRKKDAEDAAKKKGGDVYDCIGPAERPNCVFRRCPTRERCVDACLSPIPD